MNDKGLDKMKRDRRNISKRDREREEEEEEEEKRSRQRSRSSGKERRNAFRPSEIRSERARRGYI